MDYVAIFEQSPAQCPGANKEVFQLLSKQMPMMETMGRELGVKVTGLHVLLPGHLGVAIMEAPDYDAASRFVMGLGFDRWNDVSLYQSTSPEEAMKIGAERHGISP